MRVRSLRPLVHFAIASALLATAATAQAERVFVKSRGELNLAPFHCDAYSRSENVKRLCYDESNRYLLVSIKGIWYHYCTVPPATVGEFKRASSKGRYFNENVSGRFDCNEASPAPLYR